MFCEQCTVEAVVRRCSVKTVFLEISQNSQEISKNTFSYGTPPVDTSALTSFCFVQYKEILL